MNTPEHLNKTKKNRTTDTAINKEKPFHHIAIAGNIGSGKTTLTALLSKNMNWTPCFEGVDNNPYLNDFYNDMARWSFNLQVYFLNKRLLQIIDIHKSGENVIQDRTIYEDAQIFALNLHEMGLMPSRDFENYYSLFLLTMSLITPPDLIIYLRSSVAKLVNQIQKRGRVYENTIRIDYLNSLNQKYEEWAQNYNSGKLITVNIDNHDFENNPEDLRYIINLIDAELRGLF